MTCIVGIKDSKTGEIYLGGDSAAGAGGYITSRADEKVFRVGKYLIGFTGSPRLGQILRHRSQIPPFKKGSDPDEHIIQIIDEVFMAAMQKYKFAKEEDKVLTLSCGGAFTIGWKHHLYTIHSDFQYAKTNDDYLTCGSGMYLASASLYSTARTKMSSRNRVAQALEAAAYHNAYVRAPFIILSTEDVRYIPVRSGRDEAP